MTDGIEIDQLISLVQERPVLWDKSLDNYKDKNMKTAAWKEVSINLFPNFEELNKEEKTKLGNAVVKKWTGIKDNYAKYVKKLHEMNKSGAGAKKIKEYHLYKQLLFLNTNAQNETENSIIEEDEMYKDTAEPSSTSKSKAASRFVQSRKRKIIDSLEDEIIATLKQSESRHISFFKSILPSVEKLSDHQTLIFQSRVLQILTDLYEPFNHYHYPQSNFHNQTPQNSWETIGADSYQAVQCSSRNTNQASQNSSQVSQNIPSLSPSICTPTAAREDAITNANDAYYDFS